MLCASCAVNHTYYSQLEDLLFMAYAAVLCGKQLNVSA